MDSIILSIGGNDGSVDIYDKMFCIIQDVLARKPVDGCMFVKSKNYQGEIENDSMAIVMKVNSNNNSPELYESLLNFFNHIARLVKSKSTAWVKYYEESTVDGITTPSCWKFVIKMPFTD